MTLEAADVVWLDGAFVPWDDARVHVLVHALNHGTGVFEGLRAYDTASGPAIFRLVDHLRRLERSAAAILLPLPPADDLGAAARQLVVRNGFTDCYLRIAAFRGYGEMFINPDLSPVSVYVAAWRQPESFRSENGRPTLRATVSSWQRPTAAGIPHDVKVIGSYVTPAVARAEAVRNGYDEAILLSADGRVSEATIANLFVVRDGRVRTPPLADGPLPGITRETVMFLLEGLGAPCAERSLTRADLYDADEVFITGTGAEVVGIREVDGRVLRGTGELTRAVYAAYADVVRGRAEAHRDWLAYCESSFRTPAGLG
jgi:branched-chain amino acid aminotransferase